MMSQCLGIIIYRFFAKIVKKDEYSVNFGSQKFEYFFETSLLQCYMFLKVR